MTSHEVPPQRTSLPVQALSPLQVILHDDAFEQSTPPAQSFVFVHATSHGTPGGQTSSLGDAPPSRQTPAWQVPGQTSSHFGVTTTSLPASGGDGGGEDEESASAPASRAVGLVVSALEASALVVLGASSAGSTPITETPHAIAGASITHAHGYRRRIDR